MAEIIQDLKLQNDPTTIVRPNIVTGSIPSGAVTGDKIADGAITTSKVNDGAITSDKIAPASVIGGKLGVSSVYDLNIASGAVNEYKLASNAVVTSKIANGAVTNGKIADDSISLSKLMHDSVNFAKLKIQSSTLQYLIGVQSTIASLAQALVTAFKNALIIAIVRTNETDTWKVLQFVDISDTEIKYVFGDTPVTISTNAEADTFTRVDANLLTVIYIGA